MFSKLRKDHYGYIFIAPFFIIFLVFGLYPIGYSFYLSFTDWDGFGSPGLVGFENYLRLFSVFFFYKSLFITLFIWGVSVLHLLSVYLVLVIIIYVNFVNWYILFRRYKDISSD